MILSRFRKSSGTDPGTNTRTKTEDTNGSAPLLENSSTGKIDNLGFNLILLVRDHAPPKIELLMKERLKLQAKMVEIDNEIATLQNLLTAVKTFNK
jgi:hypothetical protein